MAVQFSSEDWEWHRADFDDAKQVVTIWNGPQQKSSLAWLRTGPDSILLRGLLDDEPTEISLRRVPEPRFQLNDPPELRWISIW